MVTGIVIFLPHVQSLLDMLFRPEAASEAMAIDRLAAGRLSLWKGLLFTIGHAPLALRMWCAKNIPVAITAALVSFPLTAHFFGFCTSYALLANIIVIPLAGWVMRFSAAGLALSCIHPVCAVPANLLAAFLAWLMKEISFRTAQLPGAAPNMRFSIAMLAGWYLVPLAICIALRRKQR